MTAVFFLLLSVIKLEASPIRPDVRDVLARPSHPANEFAPARAGWNGPEMTKTAPVNLTYEQIGPAGTARAVREALVGSFVPDYRGMAAVLLVILLVRRMKNRRDLQPAGQAVSLEPVGSEAKYDQPERAA